MPEPTFTIHRDQRIDAPNLTDEEVVVIAHLRGYRHLSTACRACKTERYWIDQTLSADDQVVKERGGWAQMLRDGNARSPLGQRT